MLCGVDSDRLFFFLFCYIDDVTGFGSQRWWHGERKKTDAMLQPIGPENLDGDGVSELQRCSTDGTA